MKFILNNLYVNMKNNSRHFEFTVVKNNRNFLFVYYFEDNEVRFKGNSTRILFLDEILSKEGKNVNTFTDEIKKELEVKYLNSITLETDFIENKLYNFYKEDFSITKKEKHYFFSFSIDDYFFEITLNENDISRSYCSVFNSLDEEKFAKIDFIFVKDIFVYENIQKSKNRFKILFDKKLYELFKNTGS